MIVKKRKKSFGSFTRRRRAGTRFMWSEQDQRKQFNNTVRYIVRLRREGTIDDIEFAGLVQRATASFVEKDVSSRIDRAVLDNLPIEQLVHVL